jgi:drug/metabolite transporter (DMT)-like permease
VTRSVATLLGFGAVLLWSLLALLTVQSAPVPPFLLNTLTFGIGGGAGLVWVLASGGAASLRAVPLRAYLFGALALFAYHALYFTAFRLAQPIDAAAETGLIAFLWPLFIVLFSGLLPGERLNRWHLIGAGLAFTGAGLIVLAGGRGFQPAALPAYGLALLCALTWATYSVISRRMGNVPTASVAVFCLATALLSLPLHLAFEVTVWPATARGWVAIAALGLGPVGLAFYVWDIGMKRGDIQTLGVASYAAPLLSTLALVAAGSAPATPVLALSAILITLGAGLAAWAGRRS